jgi:multiple sugar transport system permease protein
MASVPQSIVIDRDKWQRVQQAQHRRRLVGRVLLTLVTAMIVVVFVYPVFFWITASIRPFREIFTMPPPLTVSEPTGAWYSVVIGGRRYTDVLQEQLGTMTAGGTGGAGTSGYYVVPYLVASVIIGLISTALVIAVATPTAYALSRFQMRGKQNVVFFILSTRFMPAVTAILPIYLVYKQLEWIDTYHGLILAHMVINLPIATLLIKSFFDEVPTDLDDAALVDGCTRFGAFRRIIVRYVAPGLVAAGVLCLIFSWNEFIFTLYLTRGEIRTIPVAMSTFDSSSGGTEWGFLAAAGSAAMIPVFIFILFVQRNLVRGLTMGAVRG